MPVTLKYSFDNWLKNLIPGIYVTLTPTFNTSIDGTPSLREFGFRLTL